MPYLFLVWCLLGLGVLSLAVYRKVVATHEDDIVHLGAADARAVVQQTDTAERLGGIDRWGKMLTVLTLVFGLVIGTVYLYQGWLESSQKIHV